ncbi:unnamed protein product [Ceratitis capitata]|uniref:(Mediterranean fruit fly) hypothetical protein n=1 Tax=Ceratitis capitata TaxID=7213 RepID=A0A811U386_CERCA|nr:unnamed protein product [Ceratitis capitata]
MTPIFGPDTNLAEEIADHGSITIEESGTCPDRICETCILLLKAAIKFRKLCQYASKQWQELLNLKLPKSQNESSSDKSLVLLEDAEREAFTDDNLVFEVIEGFNEDCDDTNDNIIESNDAEYIEIEDDPDGFLEDSTTSQTDEITFYSNNQYDDSKHEEEAITSEEHMEKILSDKTNSDILKTYPNESNDNPECEADINTRIVPVNTQVKRGRKKLTNATKTSQKNKIQSVEISSRELKKSTNNYICSYCGNVYNEKAKLTLHLRIHTKEKPHECEICHKRFAQTPQLARHMNSHTGNRPFKCKFCEASFADPSTCIKHQRIHTQERPYVCDTCGKAFSYSNVLKVHVMSHTGEKPYNCKYCGKKFTQAHHRRTHERIHTS